MIDYIVAKFNCGFRYGHFKFMFRPSVRRFLASLGGLNLCILVLSKIIHSSYLSSFQSALSELDIWLNTNANFWAFAIATIYTLIRLLPRTSCSGQIRGTDIKIFISVRKILKIGCDFAITCSRCFDTEIGAFVKEGSLQGDFQQKYFQDISTLDKKIKKELKGVAIEQKLKRNNKKNQYSAGTVAKISLCNQSYAAYMVAIPCSTDDGGAVGSFRDMQMGIQGLWNKIIKNGTLPKFAVPVFGTGRTGLSDTGNRIIQEIVRSFISLSRNARICNELHICIHPKDVRRMKIDLNELQKFLDVECNREAFAVHAIPKNSISID